ncbi:hypothetical protein H5410_062816 [Solanum commersonii]|uniref:ATP synthase subunit epsilon, mitochondrial n=1 Tax=Solanum commersonii TaxID=4109 RepID=A0A9J5WBU4_SOLCO|nr:hypothetical protein H5410_062816 [Solanum commersonii]
MASNAAAPFWRSAGMTYITYSNLCANLVRNCLKEPYKAEALSREKVHYSISKWADGKPQKPTQIGWELSALILLKIENKGGSWDLFLMLYEFLYCPGTVQCSSPGPCISYSSSNNNIVTSLSGLKTANLCCSNQYTIRFADRLFYLGPPYVSEHLTFDSLSVEMGSVGDKLDIESDEEIPFSSSHATNKTESLHFESAHMASPRSFYSSKMHQISYFRSIYIVILKAKINVLLPFGPLAILLHYLTKKHEWVFFFSLVGIAPLAERLGYVTEYAYALQVIQFSSATMLFYMLIDFFDCHDTGSLHSIQGLQSTELLHTSAVGGLLNATFGNATEMIISLYALNNGMMRVVKQSLLGSILSNMLLVLGCAFFCGGIVHHQKVQVFSKATALVNSGLLLMAVMGLLFPAVLHFTHTEVHFGKSELALSRFSSCIMLVAYASYLFFQLKSQPNLYSSNNEDRENNAENSDEEEAPEITQWEAIGWLAILTVWISVLSGYLVDAIEGASDSMNMPVSFISVILLPIVGNAAEHASAIMFAMKDKLDITLGVAIGSSTQISMFVVRIVIIPFCVVVGWFMGKPMDLNFQLFETATLFITVLVVAFMLQEGTSNYFKGLMLILCYLIVAASFFVHVDPSKGELLISNTLRPLQHT